MMDGKQSFGEVHPELMSQWHPTKNATITPFVMLPNSRKKVWWICSLGHEWRALIHSRHHGTGCPYCTNHRLLTGFNDLATIFPDIAAQWHPTKNNGLLPSQVSPSSRMKVWWMCALGHEWVTTIDRRAYNKTGCPYCANKEVQVGYNDLAHVRPDVAATWHPSLNGSLTPEMVTSASNKKVWWKCSLGHEWQAIISKRTYSRQGCPYCSNHRVLSGFNDLAATHPEVLPFWDYEKNGILTPNQIAPFSERIVWWKCGKGHSYKKSVHKMVLSKCVCPSCKALDLSEEKCLAVRCPDLLNEWDFEKNTISPQAIFPNSHVKVWWVCQMGHHYQMQPYSKVARRCCPQCDAEKRTSFAEQAIAYYLSKRFTVASRSKVCGCEVDVYLPELKFGVEYDGLYFHSGEEAQRREQYKNTVLAENGITLIRVKESKNRDERNGNIVYCSWDKQHRRLKSAIECVIDIIKTLHKVDFTLDIDIERDKAEILNLYYVDKKENSLAKTFPLMARKWDYKKNGDITPDKVLSKSGQYFWWKCPTCGNEWYGSVCNQTNSVSALSTSCPRCIRSHGNRGTLEAGYSLASVCPELAQDWHPTKNGELKPTDVTPGSHKKVWWKCRKCGHEWETRINARATNHHTGCIKCQHSSATKSQDDFLREFKANNPYADTIELIGEYVSMKIKIHVRCKVCGYEWDAFPQSLQKGYGCRHCSWKRISEKKRKKHNML